MQILALQIVLPPWKKKQRATDKGELLHLCKPLVCADTVPVVHWSKAGKNGLDWEKGFFPNFYSSCILKAAESPNSYYQEPSNGTLCCSFYHDWPVQQNPSCYFQMK